jgi:hypothetical protein
MRPREPDRNRLNYYSGLLLYDALLGHYRIGSRKFPGSVKINILAFIQLRFPRHAASARSSIEVFLNPKRPNTGMAASRISSLFGEPAFQSASIELFK